MTWELAIPRGYGRDVVGRGLHASQLEELTRKSLAEGHALLITRTDQTPEAQKEAWAAEFYDIDKRGHKRRRFRRSATEREWEKIGKQIGKAHRDRMRLKYTKYRESNISCVNGDAMCACAVVHTKCRLETK
jgi:hypothetical protein